MKGYYRRSAGSDDLAAVKAQIFTRDAIEGVVIGAGAGLLLPCRFEQIDERLQTRCLVVKTKFGFRI